MNISLHLLKKRHLVAGGLWLCAAAGAMAVTLGPNTRSATMGQPLDISVQMLLDAGDDPAALCLDADVFYADKQLDKSRVQVATEKSGNAQESQIRIRAASPVEGPVVTVHLRAGCVQKTARRYVVLAMAKPRTAALTADNGLQAPAKAGLQPAPDSLPASEKVQALETELRQLREEQLKNQAALAQDKAQLDKAQRESYRKDMVYGLVGVLSFTFAGLLFLWRQRPSTPAAQEGRPAWWPGQAVGASPESGLSARSLLTSGSRLDLDLDIDESLFDDLKQRLQRAPPESIPPLPARDRARFSVSVPFVPRTVKVPELFDLQQQVEFFSSLGQQEKAIALLRKHLVNNVKTSALVYLDLLDLYHQTGNEEDYEVLRADFNRVFNTQIAPFDSDTADETGVAAYEDVLTRIQAAWPTRRVLEVIDDALFREPGNAAEVLDLEAYRDLLLLYAVAREIIELEFGMSGNSGDTHWPELAMQPRSSPRLGLDIDLNQLLGGSDSLGKTPGRRAGAASSSVTRDVRSGGAASTGSRLAAPHNPLEPTVLDSLVDFDDYDTGFRPEDFGKPARS